MIDRSSTAPRTVSSSELRPSPASCCCCCCIIIFFSIDAILVVVVVEDEEDDDHVVVVGDDDKTDVDVGNGGTGTGTGTIQIRRYCTCNMKHPTVDTMTDTTETTKIRNGIRRLPCNCCCCFPSVVDFVVFAFVVIFLFVCLLLPLGIIYFVTTNRRLSITSSITTSHSAIHRTKKTYFLLLYSL